ncbi:hypothetical protein O181_007500 [Austropuccinia psidii MF-1]|uniref:Uncharacterized protein n=1 Tax=Austropuccinia psidii MF-1 TaxID=1389203 RepID=A0A9Q3GHY0_9BASI|nr:hypothetical protein [Austropuccinia psidii MF-1]
MEEDSFDTVVGGKTLREIITNLPFPFQFNRNLKPEDWKYMDQVHQLHQLLKDLFQWRMDNKMFNLTSNWEEIGSSCQKICLKEIPFKDPMVITKGWNPTRQFRLLEERETRIRENQATIQAIEEQMRALESQGTSHRTEKAFPEPEDLKEDTLEIVVDGKTLRGLEGYGSSLSASTTPERAFPMEHEQQGVPPRIPPGRTWSKFPEDMSQKDTLERPCGNHQKMESHQEF